MQVSIPAPPARRWPTPRYTALPTLLALVTLASVGPVQANEGPAAERGPGASRISASESASEYWDLVARLDSGHRVLARFLITNEGPGALSAVAFGHVVMPDGRTVFFDNAKRRGDWELAPDGRRIRIASSILDQQVSPPKFEYDSNKRGVKVHLWFEPEGGQSWPAPPSLGDYRVDLIAPAAPVRGTLWVAGMPEAIDVSGTLAFTHTWMERSESDVALRRIDFFSLEPGSSLFVSDLTTPRGERARWLVATEDGRVVRSSSDFEVEVTGRAGSGPPYPVPGALRLRGPSLEGEVQVGSVLLAHDPFASLPQPFRFLLSLRAQPHRVWTQSPYEVRLKAESGRPDWVLRGSGLTSVTFSNPLPAELTRLPSRSTRIRGA